MAKQPKDIEPRTFFLNELHELREEHSGGGGKSKFGAIDWYAH